MRQSGQPPTQRTAARSARTVATLLVALALSGCLFTATPTTPAPPTPTPTPLPTPTPTAQQRVAFPTPTPSPSPTPTPIRELRDAGELLYIGRHDGKSGVVATSADGARRRLLAEGDYSQAGWSPDGQRFVAIASKGGPGPSRVDLHAADGRLLRSATFAGYTNAFFWAPDSRHLALLNYAPSTDSRLYIGATWLLSEEGAVEGALGQHAYPIGWSPQGRLALVAYQNPGGNGPTAADTRGIWTVDATGGDARRLTTGDLFPLAWSADGQVLYAADDPRPSNIGSPEASAPPSLLVIDANSGEYRPVTTAEQMAAQIIEDGKPAPERWLRFALAAPAGDRIARWLAIGGPTHEERALLVVVDRGGRVLWHDHVAAADPAVTAWSPDGSRLAYRAGDGRNAGNSLRIATLATAETRDLAGNIYGSSSTPPAAQWSPDGHWLAVAHAGRIEIAATDASAQSWVLAPNAHSPAWRPAPKP